MRLPRIKTRMANILAKLSGSEDYDPKVKPLTPAEYYADQIPVIPKPNASDAGMALIADGKGGYTFSEGGGGTLYVNIITNSNSAKSETVTPNPHLDKTYKEIKTAIDADKCIIAIERNEPEGEESAFLYQFASCALKHGAYVTSFYAYHGGATTERVFSALTEDGVLAEADAT